MSQDKKETQLLGKFDYCGQVVILRQATDESYWEVQAQGPYTGDVLIRDADLRVSRGQFEDVVCQVIGKISFTDVSIYGQQKAPRET